MRIIILPERVLLQVASAMAATTATSNKYD